MSHGWKIRRGGVETSWGFIAGAVVKIRESRDAFEYLALEARLIRRLQPQFNRRGVRDSIIKSPAKSQCLTRGQKQRKVEQWAYESGMLYDSACRKVLERLWGSIPTKKLNHVLWLLEKQRSAIKSAQQTQESQ